MVDEETGAARIDLKPHTTLELRDQRSCLRARTQPTQAQLEWVRSLLRDGRLEQEGQAIFLRHCGRPRWVPGMDGAHAALQDEDIDSAGSELDRAMGVSGCVCALRQRARHGSQEGDPSLVLTLEGFMESFWELLWGVQREFCQALARKSVRRQEDPRDVYDFLRTLGSGTYGEVRLARDKATGARRAIKRVNRKDCGVADKLDEELEHLRLLDHPHIVRLYEHYEDKDYIYLVMDYCSGGELQEAIVLSREARQHLPEEFVSDVMRQVLLAMAHVHCRGIVHMDVKSANIMLMPSLESTMLPGRSSGHFTLRQVYEQPHVMVIDLGVAQIFQPGNFRYNRPMGTPATMAPEVWVGDITPKADVFSCGVVLFELLALSLPFNCTARHEEAMSYWFGMPSAPWSRTQHASNDAVELCRRMIRLDRHQRPAASSCLRAPFFEEPGALDDSAGAVVELLKGLADVPKRSLLHNSVALSIAQAWPSNQLPTIKCAFRELDVDGSGRLTKGQIASALERLGVDCEHAVAAADAMDLSRSGTIDWTEFVAACLRLGREEFTEDLQRIFKEADADGDGLLTQKDVSQLLAADHLHGDAVRDLFADLVGRVEPTARVDWPTFRRHFRSRSEGAAGTSPNPQTSAGTSTAEIMEHARDLWERARDTFWPSKEDPGEPDEEKVRRLAEMGFTDRERCVATLKRHRNKLSGRVVEELMRGGPPSSAGRQRHSDSVSRPARGM